MKTQALKEFLLDARHAANYPVVLRLYILTAAALLVYANSFLSAAEIWHNSEIYTHGYFILPICIYLVWRQQNAIKALAPTPSLWPILLLVILSLIGVVGFAGRVNIFSHAATFLSLPLIAWSLLGTRIALKLWFPMLFVVFCIPVGDQLIPHLQEITADMAMVMLGMTDIPVFRTGLYIEIPAGRFVVAEACSGIRFFLGSIVFGSVYTYISFQSLHKRIIFMSLSILIPIVANAIRVFGIILVGHFSDMKHATGADHLVYGWVFFAIVLLLLILIGERFREETTQATENVKVHTAWQTQTSNYAVIAISIILAATLTWKQIIAWNTNETTPQAPTLPSAVQHWPETSGFYWQPLFQGATQEHLLKFNDSYFYRAWYAKLSEQTELISNENRYYDPNKWTLVASDKLLIHKLENHEVNISHLELTNVTNNRMHVYYWYELNNKATGNELMAKLIQTWDVMSGGQGSGSLKVYATPSALTPDNWPSDLISP